MKVIQLTENQLGVIIAEAMDSVLWNTNYKSASDIFNSEENQNRIVEIPQDKSKDKSK